MSRSLAVVVFVFAGIGCATAGEDLASPDGGLVDGPDATVGEEPDAGTPDNLADAGVQNGCAAAIASMATDWEAGPSGWTHGNMPIVDPPPVTWTFDHWQHGNPSSGPGSCNSGSGCWATNLTGNYISCQRAFLASPTLDLTECAGTSVNALFQHYYDFWTGTESGQTWFDGGLIEFSGDGGATWQSATATYPGTIRINPNISTFRCVRSTEFHVHNRPGYVGASAGWEPVTVEIPEAVKTSQFRMRFAYASGVSGATAVESQTMQFTRPGWFIDDLRLESE